MDQREPDPVFRNARREALIILGVYATALVYTVGYCYLFGYNRPALSVDSYWGIPTWVFWGVFAPWTVCALFITGFTFFYMTDDDLGSDDVPDEDGADAR